MYVNQLGQDASTWQAFDTINGGAGTDTMNIYAKTAGVNSFNVTQPGVVNSVEIVNVFNTESETPFGGVAIDASKFVGVQQLWQIDGANDITKLASSTTAGFRGNGDVDVAIAAAAGNSSINVVFDQTDAGEADLEVSGASLNTVNLGGTLTYGEDDCEGNATVEQGTVRLGVNSGSGTKLTLNSSLNVSLNVVADTVVIGAGASRVFNAGDYVTLTETISGFEVLDLQSDGANTYGIDASRLTGYSEINLAGEASTLVVTKADATKATIGMESYGKANLLVLTAADYSTATTPTTYGKDLAANVSGATTLNVRGNSLKLDVDGGAASFVTGADLNADGDTIDDGEPDHLDRRWHWRGGRRSRTGDPKILGPYCRLHRRGVRRHPVSLAASDQQPFHGTGTAGAHWPGGGFRVRFHRR